MSTRFHNSQIKFGDEETPSQGISDAVESHKEKKSNNFGLTISTSLPKTITTSSSREREERFDKKTTEKEPPKEKGSVSFRKLTSAFCLQLTGSLFQAILTIVACVVYVVSTYIQDENVTTFKTIEITIALLFTLDYVFGFAAAKDKKKFILEPLNMIDLIIIIPVYISLLNVKDN